MSEKLEHTGGDDTDTEMVIVYTDPNGTSHPYTLVPGKSGWVAPQTYPPFLKQALEGFANHARPIP